MTVADLMTFLATFRQSDSQAFVTWIATNEGKVYPMLSPYGFHGSWVKPEAYLADFDRAYDTWLRASGPRLQDLATIRLPELSPEEIRRREAEDNQQVMGELPDGTPYNTTRRNLRLMRQQMYYRRAMQTLRNIESGLGGTIGYAVGGDKGSDLGATLGDLAGAFGGTLENRQAFRDVGASLGPSRPAVAEVRPASPPPAEPRTGENAPLLVGPPAPIRPSARPPVRGATAVPASRRTQAAGPAARGPDDIAAVHDEATQGTGRGTRSPAGPDELNAAAGDRVVEHDEAQALSPRYAGDRFDAATSEEELVLLAQEVLPAYSYDPATRGRIVLRGGRQVGARSAGSTVPDLYLRGRRARAGDARLPPVSLEAKNYLVGEKGSYEEFIQATVRQAQQRAAALPKTAQQYLLIDLRGQDVSRDFAAGLRRDLAARSNGLLRYDRIYLLPRALE
jgi:hypothetical protein